MRAVLCDIDGTLVDSNDAHAFAWVDALVALGHPVTFERIRPLIGMGGDKLMPTIGIDPSSALGKEAGARSKRIFLETYLRGLRPFAGARALLERIRATGRTVVAATSAADKEVRAILHHAGLLDLFALRTSSDDVDESKPSPDIVVAALGRAGVEPEEAVMIGDTPYDVQAARHANVRCVAFRCGGDFRDEDFDGAAEIHDGPKALLAAWDASLISR